jgi:hypothetical protein
MAIVIKLLEDGHTGTAALESRRYTMRFSVSGLSCGVPPLQTILPTASSPGLFPLPGSFPSALPNNDGAPTTIPDLVRVVDVRVEKVTANGTVAIVAMDMETRIGTFDMTGAFLLDMRISSAVEYIPSNFDIATTGLRNALAKVRYLNNILGNTTESSRIAQLSIPRNRKTVTIVQAEPTNYASTSHATKSGYCAFTNSETFWGGAARTWLCTALESQWTGFNDKPWHTTYQFVYNPDQWTGVAYFNDQSLGLPMQNIVAPANFNPGTESVSPYGCKVFRIAGEVDFTTLLLPDFTTAG